MDLKSLFFGNKDRRRVQTGPVETLEQKLAALRTSGISLEEPFTTEDLLSSFARADFERPGFELLLVALGSTEEQPPWRPRCSILWHFDTECIEDHGSYSRIATRLSRMAQGSLPLENIRDHVDLETETAWLEFELKGKTVRIDCDVNDDWVDAKVFSRFVALLNESDSSRVFLYYDLKGQDCILACVEKKHLLGLDDLGIAFVPLR